MKTAISILDDLFQEAEKLAAILELSRSALYAKALREMLERLESEAVTAQINAAIADAPIEPEPGFRSAHLRLLRRQMDRDGGNW